MADIESCGCESEPHTCEDPDIADLEREIDELREDRDRTAEQLAARDAALGACAARIAELLAQVGALAERRDALLALVANISQTTPLASELEGWEGQRAALVAEVGTLRARVAEAERERDEARAALAEACDIAAFYAGDGADPEAMDVCRLHAARIVELRKIAAATPARPPIEPSTIDSSRDHDAAIVLPADDFDRLTDAIERPAAPTEALRALLAEDHATRPPLDLVHVAVLRGMLDEEREKSVTAMHAEMRNHYAQRASAIEAALGEEVRP